MSAKLNSIKSIHIIKIFLDYIPYLRFLKTVKHSKEILKRLDITIEYFKNASAIQRVLDPSYDIQLYYHYFAINEEKKEMSQKKSKKKINVNEYILYKCLNSLDFNKKLSLQDNDFKSIINNAYKINLVINPETIHYMKDINEEIKEGLYSLLNKNIIHIKEITICKFNSANKEDMNYIIDIIKRIFIEEQLNINSNNINNINKPNNTHCVKKFNFLENSIYQQQFFNKINDIISLNKTALNIDFNLLNKDDIDQIYMNICNSISFINSLRLNMEYEKKDCYYIWAGDYSFFRYRLKNNLVLKENTLDLCKLIEMQKNNIEILDLSNYLAHPIILQDLNSNLNMPNLKELKLYLDFCEDNKKDYKYKDDWNFIHSLVDTLEVFELNITYQNKIINFSVYNSISATNKKTNFSFNNLISALNKIKKLERLKLIANISSEALIKFKNFENIKYLNISIFDKLTDLNAFISSFINLESLSIENKSDNNLFSKDCKLIFPPKLKSLEFKNFNLNEINSILQSNKQSLCYIQKFGFDLIKKDLAAFRQLIFYYSINFKKLKYLFVEFAKIYFDSEILSILKVIPSLMELKILMGETLSYYEKRVNKTYFESSPSELIEKNSFLNYLNEKMKKDIKPNIINLNFEFLDCNYIISTRNKIFKIPNFSYEQMKKMENKNYWSGINQ